MQLVIRDLSTTYPNGTRALQGVSLDIPKGMFGLLGRNGAGKSTLMRIIATLQEPDEGSVRLGDIDVLRQPYELRKTLGYLPQSFGFHPKAKAERLLEHFAVLKGIEERGVRRDVVESLLRQTNLWDVRGDRLGTFSGGMRQRFGVAVALLGNPQLIIVDEPTATRSPRFAIRCTPSTRSACGKHSGAAGIPTRPFVHAVAVTSSLPSTDVYALARPFSQSITYLAAFVS
jgi:ABC-2 type transport system ATP-binding protein